MISISIVRDREGFVIYYLANLEANEPLILIYQLATDFNQPPPQTYLHGVL